MAKMIDITEKLNFEQKPQIKIRDEVLTVNNEAVAVLEIMPLFENENSTSADFYKACKILFSEEDFAKIQTLGLGFGDFTTLIRTAISLVAGNTSGETVTRATT